jgi:hypothetical protein
MVSEFTQNSCCILSSFNTSNLSFYLCFVKVPWCRWKKKLQSIPCQRNCNVCYLAGKHFVVTFTMSEQISSLVYKDTNFNWILFFGIMTMMSFCYVYLLNLIVYWCASVDANVFMQVARIILFLYLFYHIFMNYDQVLGGSDEFSVQNTTTHIYLSVNTFLLTG